MGWNFGDLFDGLAQAVPADAPALIHEDRMITWGELDARSNRLARALLATGAQPGDKIGVYLRNRPEYLETVIALFKARLVHVNINYRYRRGELKYIIENSDARAIVFAAEFADEVAGLREADVAVEDWIEVRGPDDVPAHYAADYEALATTGDATPLGVERSPDDLLFIYTGGTTGMPKAVMWRQEDLWYTLGGGGNPVLNIPPPADLAAHVANVAAAPFRARQMPLSPLMHGAGLMTALMTLLQGGCVVTLGGGRFDPVRALETLARHKVNAISIVGDAFARPLVEALQQANGAHDLSALRTVVSTGVMWSPQVKAALLEQCPQLMLMDALGSSEGTGFGMSVSTAEAPPAAAKFMLGQNVKVFTEDFREVAPGSGETGYIARSGPVPLGYYKDPEKSARTFPEIDGVRYTMPGDQARVEADGTLVLLGRGNMVINTGGEKVYVEEVEETLKSHEAVVDALVVGLPDPQWGQSVNAMVQLREGSEASEQALREHVRGLLADYKSPKRVVFVAEVPRGANGKADYREARVALEAAVGQVVAS